jgi:hypothetical protein
MVKLSGIMRQHHLRLSATILGNGLPGVVRYVGGLYKISDQTARSDGIEGRKKNDDHLTV